MEHHFRAGPSRSRGWGAVRRRAAPLDDLTIARNCARVSSPEDAGGGRTCSRAPGGRLSAKVRPPPCRPSRRRQPPPQPLPCPARPAPRPSRPFATTEPSTPRTLASCRTSLRWPCSSTWCWPAPSTSASSPSSARESCRSTRAPWARRPQSWAPPPRCTTTTGSSRARASLPPRSGGACPCRPMRTTSWGRGATRPMGATPPIPRSGRPRGSSASRRSPATTSRTPWGPRGPPAPRGTTSPHCSSSEKARRAAASSTRASTSPASWARPSSPCAATTAPRPRPPRARPPPPASP